jgi:phosphoribosylglycinamide formyltransferase 1
VRSAVVLISGRGSNLRAVVEARTGLEVRAVLSNQPDAAGLQWARTQGLEARTLDHRAFADRAAFDAALASAIESYTPDVILLAGFMRIFTDAFIARFAPRIVNIHPALLPAFPGLRTHARALAAGVKIHGATVHIVTPTLDSGPILIQGAVPVLAGDTEASLAERVLAVEHRIYPQAVRWLVEGRVTLASAGVVQPRVSGVGSDSMLSPRDP